MPAVMLINPFEVAEGQEEEFLKKQPNSCGTRRALSRPDSMRVWTCMQRYASSMSQSGSRHSTSKQP